MAGMDDLRVGRVIRTVRLRLGLRQADVAERAGVSQQTVAVIEAGRLEEVTLRALRAVGAVLRVTLSVTPRWKGGEVDRLLDRDHAIVADVAVPMALGNRDINRFFVDIQPYEHATVPHTYLLVCGPV